LTSIVFGFAAGDLGRCTFSTPSLNCAAVFAASARGRVFPLNPNHRTILGQKAFPKIGEVPEDI
jgi:hypothetical protein